MRNGQALVRLPHISHRMLIGDATKPSLFRNFAGGFSLANAVTYESESFVQEARVSSNLFELADVTLGYYFEDQERGFDSLLLYGGTVFPAVQFVTDGISSTRTGLKHHALFGEAEIHITDDFSVLGGVRWFDQKREAGSSTVFGTGPSNVQTEEVDASDTVFKAGLKYEVKPDNSLYATWSEGIPTRRCAAASIASKCLRCRQ